MVKKRPFFRINIEMKLYGNKSRIGLNNTCHLNRHKIEKIQINRYVLCIDHVIRFSQVILTRTTVTYLYNIGLIFISDNNSNHV